MKKFSSFKPDKPTNPANPVKPIIEKKSAVIVEDSSFGKRLDFSVVSTSAPTPKPPTPSIDSVATTMKRRQDEFNRKLRQEPNNVSLWIEFVQFQDELVIDGKHRKLVERKLSILKRAIEFNQSDLRLIFMYLGLSEDIEDSSTMMRLWEKFLKQEVSGDGCSSISSKSGGGGGGDSNSRSDGGFLIELTIGWLNYLQNRFLAFSFDQVNEAFADAFKNTFKESTKLIGIYFKFLMRCGYSDRVIAIGQALIELNVEVFNFGQVDLEGYEDQWDSGLMDHVGDSIIRNSSKPSLYPIGDNGDNNLLEWLRVERHRQSNFWHPLHDDLTDIDDDCGQVMFDDISDFLIISNTPEEAIDLIEGVLIEIESCFKVKNSFNNFQVWFAQVHEELLPFFMENWKFIYRLFCLKGSNDYAMKIITENKESLECFMAYGKFQEWLGNSEMASKVFQSIRKRTNKFHDSESSISVESVKDIEIDPSKSNVYELVRSNPGNKQLYMEIIEKTALIDEPLGIEVFNLIDEQQLRLHALLEECTIGE